MKFLELHTNPTSVPFREVPRLSAEEFRAETGLLFGDPSVHCFYYTGIPSGNGNPPTLVMALARDATHSLLLAAREVEPGPGPVLESLSADHPQLAIFEREIAEQFGICFEGHPWMKPVRFPSGNTAAASGMNDYPFFRITGEALHEVGVGPIHAGVIEPGHFRFICRGETVLHLEIQLGYQHRGIEKLLAGAPSLITRSALAESIAGDTAAGHSLCHAMLTEQLGGLRPPESLQTERTIALELERIAVHIGDTAALCNDVAYQFGQVVNEALRTIVINTSQFWCGNRFSKGLIRPGGTRYPLNRDVLGAIRANLLEVQERYEEISARIFSMPSVLGRFESIGRVTLQQAAMIGAVGMAARSSGLKRDIRWSHPDGNLAVPFEPVILEGGDVWSRAMLRSREIGQSVGLVLELLAAYEPGIEIQVPAATIPAAPDTLAIAAVEGWRGEICHLAVTGGNGQLVTYRAKDPSLHNWMALALAVRNQEISDFPLCNKSFNLSYCGHDS